MSIQPAPAPNMTETVIKHYKKQLIYRQHDVPDESTQLTKIYDFVESEKRSNDTKKTRRKRKNKNCRGQFRHEAMELIKLGSNASHSLCKAKDPLSKPPDKDDRNVPQYKSDSVIQPNHVTKTILETTLSQGYGHALPQMVPERRNSRELLPPKVPVIYRSPPHGPALPEYRPYQLPHPAYGPPLAFRPTPTLPPPPPYPVARSPPRPVPRPPIRPIPQPAFPKNAPYAGIHFPFSRPHNQYSNGYQSAVPSDYSDRGKKRKHEDASVVAAIDLTVDQKDKGQRLHKCHCECGKTYTSDPVTQEVIISVTERDSSQVPSTYMRGKMVNGVLQFDKGEAKAKQNGTAKCTPPVITKVPVPDKPPSEGKLPQLFLIEDLLAKGVRVEQKPRPDTNGKLIPEPIPEPNRVIVSTKSVEEKVPRAKSKDHSVSTIMGTNSRRQSVDIDTISISSSGSESVRSPRPKSNGTEKLIPHGKLFYYKSNNSFIRYFDDTQKKLFIDNITSDFDKNNPEDKEIIELPRNTMFNCKDNLTVEEYVSEMTLVEKFIPRDFFLFYKFVTGYQICNNNLPVSFLTFLKVYNTNGLKVLLERYVNSLKPN